MKNPKDFTDDETGSVAHACHLLDCEEVPFLLETRVRSLLEAAHLMDDALKAVAFDQLTTQHSNELRAKVLHALAYFRQLEKLGGVNHPGWLFVSPLPNGEIRDAG